MADTITILDGLQFEKASTADVYTMDGDGVECVKTFALAIPSDASSMRVIFNGAYDPNGGRYHGRVKLTGVTSLDPLTKVYATQVLEWTTITPPAVQKSGDVDVSTYYKATVYIDIAQSSTTANTTGIEIIVQVRKKATVNEWVDIHRFVTLANAAASKSDCVGTPAGAAAATTLGVTNPATGNLDHVGKFIFIEDTATIAQCEIAFLVSQSGN